MLLRPNYCIVVVIGAFVFSCAAYHFDCVNDVNTTSGRGSESATGMTVDLFI
jgi:hypothetical protein